MGVDAEVQLTQRGEVLHHFGFRHFRQRQIIAQKRGIRHGGSRHIQCGCDRSNPTGHTPVHQQTGRVSISAFIHHLAVCLPLGSVPMDFE